MIFIIIRMPRMAKENNWGGVGIFVLVLMGLVLTLAMAALGFSFLMTPFTLTQELLTVGGMAWILPMVLLAGLAGNIALCKTQERWRPIIPFAAMWVFFLLLYTGLVISNPEIRQQSIGQHLLMYTLGCLLMSVAFFPFSGAVMAVTAVPTLFIRRDYLPGVLLSLAGLVCGVLAFQGAVETIVGLFGQSAILDVTSLHFMDVTLGITERLSEAQRAAMITQYQAVADGLAKIPAFLRLLISAPLCLLCVNEEAKLAGVEPLF